MLEHIRPITGPKPRPYVDPVPRLPKVRRDDRREDEPREDAEGDGEGRRERRQRPDDGHIDVLA